jgi:hypothetical protein
MSLTTDIVASYRGPRKVVRRLSEHGPREDRALAFLMGACLVFFIAQWPVLAREAHLTGGDLNSSLAGALTATLLFLPLFFYAVSFVAHLFARVIGGIGTPFGSRLALFWALIAASPLRLLVGLVAGFIGEGVQLQLVEFIWFAVFAWFWISGMVTVHREDT